jgi:hypothetical protein
MKYYIFNLVLMKKEPQIVRGPIKEILCFLFNLFEKWAPNWPKADKGDFVFLSNLFEKWAHNRPKADKEDFMIRFF